MTRSVASGGNRVVGTGYREGDRLGCSRFRSPNPAAFGRPFEQVQTGQAGKTVDAPVDAARHLAALVAGEEVAGQELGLGGGHHAGTDRVPEMTESESCDPPGPRAGAESRL